MRASMSRLFRASLLLIVLAGLGGCGFHLRQSVALPPTMQHIHINGNGDLQRRLTRALVASGITVEDKGGPGIAEMQFPTSSFSTETVSVSGYAQVTEYAVHYHVQFYVNDHESKPLVALQNIEMSREFSYDAYDPIGNASQVQEIQGGLIGDMVQSILFRLRAAEKHPEALKVPQSVAPLPTIKPSGSL